ncbi:MAG: sulfatase-like hydrolase/transferase [Methanothrix sp.]|uniref:sulfatase-like hydrolase/transferase n=1 Tax=Methanothrix sp. TaxID=90426 RepID=UPI003BAFC137
MTESRGMLLAILLLLLLLPGGGALEVQVGPTDRPAGAVILVIDGLGSSYVYPEHNAYALDGSPLGKAVLFNLTGGGARAVDVRVPVPETTKSHSILVTGRTGADWNQLGPTIFDLARERGYLCLAIMERGDSMSILEEMDAVLYLEDNSLRGAEPIPGFSSSAPAGLTVLFQEWRDRFAEYSNPQGIHGYAGYNAWALDAAADTVEHLIGKPFILLVNAGAVDSAGHNLNASGYLKTVEALDEPLGRLAGACRRNEILLMVTADHGMVFPDPKGKGGHSAEKYAARLEALRVPLVITGPGIEELNLGGLWSEVDVAPTVLSLLEISSNESTEGLSLPIRAGSTLRVRGAPAGLELWRDGIRLAAASGDEEELFRGLVRGEYTLRGEGLSMRLLVDGEQSVDLRGEKALPEGARRGMGVAMILAINLAGTAAIVRIWRRE